MSLLCVRAGKVSDSIAELRKQSGTFLTMFLATHNQSTEEGELPQRLRAARLVWLSALRM